MSKGVRLLEVLDAECRWLGCGVTGFAKRCRTWSPLGYGIIVRVKVVVAAGAALVWMLATHRLIAAQGDPEQQPVIPSRTATGSPIVVTNSSTSSTRASAAEPTDRPIEPTATSTTNGRTVLRRGVAIFGGVEFVQDTSVWRVDAVMPIPVSSAPALRAGLELTYGHESAAASELAIDAHSFSLTPSAYYDWRLPIRSSLGDFVFQAGGGVTLSFARVKVDAPYMPGEYESIRAYALRTSGGFQFRARGGWILSIPIGFTIPVGDPVVAEPLRPYTTNSGDDVIFDLALLGGYQFE